MNKTKKIAILGIVALFAVLAVSTATAHVTMYLDPQHSSVPDGFGYTTEVKVMANVTGADTLQGGQFNIEYDTSCCNVTDLAWGSGIFSGFSVWNPIGLPECHPPGREHIRYYFMSVQSDVVAEICTLTFYCNSTEYCQADVTFPCPPSGPCITEVMNETNDNLYPDSATLVNGTFTGGTPEPGFDNVTTRDIPVSGTVSGNHTLTHESDNVYESIEELAITTGKPSGRISYLEHIWTIDVISGTKTNVTFHIEANHTTNDENDHFVFAYSTDNISYSDMVTVYNTDDNNEYQIYKLPNETSGIVYIRVMDTDRTGENNDPDTIYIDHMYIRSVLGPPDETPPVITNVTNTDPTHNSATIEWDTDEPADSVVKYGTASGSYTWNESDATSVTSHSIELTGLESNTTYYYVVNSTDPSGNSNESAEYSFTTESQPSMPDLEITDIWCQYVRKNTYDIYYNITNNGGVEAGRSDSNWTVDGVEEGTDKVASLAPGQTREEKFRYRGSAPSTVKVCADYNSEIDESDETNNCLEKTVTCT